MRAVALFAGVLGLGLAAWGVLRVVLRVPVVAPATPVAAAPAASSPEPRRVEAGDPLTRDLLRYQISPEPQPVTQLREWPLLLPPAPVSPPPTERLVGFVRRGGQLFVALNLPTGETVVWSVGPQPTGYELLALDEERGAHLRRPDGTDVTLTAP